ncbi:MAG: hypothetical protein K1W19_10370 [Lachnospiraceae bacterium]
MKDYLVDVSVLLIFFSRSEQFKQVFEQVKKARPSRLFLYQDGPRADREDDIKGIMACRAIAEDIDWNCKVERLYQKENKGCDPSEYLAQKWAFSYVDKCIVLEDDDVPAISFFTFCKDLLDRYEYDNRIMLISGFNHEEVTKGLPYDYLFTSNVSIWGWATWKRVIDTWDAKYEFLEDEYAMRLFQLKLKNAQLLRGLTKVCERHKKENKEFYETILISNQWMQNGLSIVPRKNMITNIGIISDSTHFSGDIQSQPKAMQKIYTMKRFEIKFPLKHPKYIMEDYEFKDRVYRIMGWNHPLVKIYRSLEVLLKRIARGNGMDGIRDFRSKIYCLLKQGR